MKKTETMPLVNGIHSEECGVQTNVRQWLDSQNSFLSILLEEPVSNLQMLHAVNVAAAFIFTAVIFGHLYGTIIGITWLTASVASLCRTEDNR